MILYNGSTDTLPGKVEGTAYPIPAGKVVDVPSAFHANLLLAQFGARGLVPVAVADLVHGEPTDEIKKLAREAFLEFVEAQFRTFNELQMQRNKEGRPGVVATKELRHLQSVYQQLKGREFSLDEASMKPDDQAQNVAKALVSALMTISGKDAQATRSHILDMAGVPAGPGMTKAIADAAAGKEKSKKD